MEITSKPSPKLNLPKSNATVRVRAIDTEAKLVVNSNAFVQPPIKGHEKLNLTTMCFLVEHEGSGGTEYVLFDCGPRKDLWNTTPKTQQKIGSFVPGVEVERGVDEVLTSKGFDLNNLPTFGDTAPSLHDTNMRPDRCNGLESLALGPHW